MFVQNGLSWLDLSFRVGVRIGKMRQKMASKTSVVHLKSKIGVPIDVTEFSSIFKQTQSISRTNSSQAADDDSFEYIFKGNRNRKRTSK